jgi:hypothetical protein
MNDIVQFKHAGLPALDPGTFRKALTNAASVAAPGNTPFLRMLKGNGMWVYGANETEVQPGSHWAINPLSLQAGWVCWNPEGGKPLGKRMVSIFQPPISRSDLPDIGNDWDENISFQLQCVTGEDKDLLVEYTANSYGGRKAFGELTTSFQRQLDVDAKLIVPIVELLFETYKHSTYGQIYNPVFKIEHWVSMEGAPAAPQNGAEAPAAAAAPAPAGEPQKPRRAPVGAPQAPAAEAKASPEAPPPAADPVQRRRRRPPV